MAKANARVAKAKEEIMMIEAKARNKTAAMEAVGRGLVGDHFAKLVMFAIGETKRSQGTAPTMSLWARLCGNGYGARAAGRGSVQS